MRRTGTEKACAPCIALRNTVGLLQAGLRAHERVDFPGTAPSRAMAQWHDTDP